MYKLTLVLGGEMRLYIDENGKKIYLRQKADTRRELIAVLGSNHLSANGKVYRVNRVSAEPDNSSTTVGASIGGVIGVLGGVPGVIAGAIIGSLLGNSQLEKDRKMAEAFNASCE